MKGIAVAGPRFDVTAATASRRNRPGRDRVARAGRCARPDIFRAFCRGGTETGPYT